jgi:hypothetical protein
LSSKSAALRDLLDAVRETSMATQLARRARAPDLARPQEEAERELTCGYASAFFFRYGGFFDEGRAVLLRVPPPRRAGFVRHFASMVVQFEMLVVDCARATESSSVDRALRSC